jgi:hypothetical protein
MFNPAAFGQPSLPAASKRRSELRGHIRTFAIIVAVLQAIPLVTAVARRAVKSVVPADR